MRFVWNLVFNIYSGFRGPGDFKGLVHDNLSGVYILLSIVQVRMTGTCFIDFHGVYPVYFAKKSNKVSYFG